MNGQSLASLVAAWWFGNDTPSTVSDCMGYECMALCLPEEQKFPAGCKFPGPCCLRPRARDLQQCPAARCLRLFSRRLCAVSMTDSPPRAFFNSWGNRGHRVSVAECRRSAVGTVSKL